MTEHGEFEQDLVELALGEVAEPRRSELLSHLSGCLRCRTDYAEVVGAIDATVPAAPEVSPPAGFEARVLSALGVEQHERAGPVRRLAQGRRARPLLAAAAVALVAAAGTLGVESWLDGTDGARQVDEAASLPEGTAVLRTDDGQRVGTAALAWMHESRVLVVSVDTAPVGVHYSCRVRLAEGGSRVLGRWASSSPDGGVWVMPAPQGELNTLELVTDSGTVWSSTRLP